MCAGRTSSIGARLLRHRGSIEGRTLRLNNGSTTTNSPTFNTFIHASCYQNSSLYYLVNVLEKGIETDPRLCIVSFPFCLPPMYPLACLLSVYLIRFFSFQVSFLFADFIRKREVVYCRRNFGTLRKQKVLYTLAYYTLCVLTRRCTLF